MKVKALERFYTGSGFCEVGDVVNVGQAKGTVLISVGKAEKTTNKVAKKEDKPEIETKEEKAPTDTKEEEDPASDVDDIPSLR